MNGFFQRVTFLKVSRKQFLENFYSLKFFKSEVLCKLSKAFETFESKVNTVKKQLLRKFANSFLYC